MDHCKWTIKEKALFFDFLRFAYSIRQLDVNLTDREVRLSYQEYHTHISFWESFDDVQNHISSFIKDYYEWEKINLKEYLHKEITSREFHQKAIENNKVNSSYVSKEYSDNRKNNFEQLISKEFWSKPC